MGEVILDNLDSINLKKIKNFSYKNLSILCNQIRSFLIKTISKTGGHIGANLGTIEITVAIHKIFNSPENKIIFDTGHQAYTHKILTGRIKKFRYLNQYKKGFSRFTDRRESKHDIVDVSHAATSISLSAGLAISKNKSDFKNTVISIIGDGSLVEGMAFESLNYVANKKIPLLIVLVDNGYAIDKNVGGIKNMTTGKNWKNKSKNFFESLGFNYFCEEDGHNVKKLCLKLEKLKNIKKSTIFHIKTIKGHGLKLADKHPYRMHFSMPFNIDTGQGVSSTIPGKSYSTVISNQLDKYLKKKKDIFLITPATPYSNDLQHLLKKYPKNTLDVGMAEQHAAGMSAGVSLNKKKIILFYQSTFMQRAFDQIFHDIAYMKLPVTIISSRSGFAGYDSATHHSIMDLSYLRAIPNISIYYPSTLKDCENVVKKRINKNQNNPMIILHPYEPVKDDVKIKFRGNEYDYLIKDSNKNLLITTGNYLKRANQIKKNLLKNNKKISIVCIKRIKPISIKISKLLSDYSNISVVEENTLLGGLGSAILELNNSSNKPRKLMLFGIKDKFIEPGSSKECSIEANIDPTYISKKLDKFFDE